MPAFFPVKERVQESDMCFSNLVQQDAPTARNKSILIPKVSDDLNSPILPGLSDDVSKHCLALLPRSHFPAVGAVCKRWRSFIKGKEFITVRKLAGVLEEWLYVLTVDAEGNGSHWEVLDCLGHKHHQLRPMPGPAKAGLAWSFSMGSFWLLLVIWWLMAPAQSQQIYTNTILASIGGCGADGESLSGAEVYDPESDKWTVIESEATKVGCFACGVEGKLYVMGGRSSFTIGNSRFVDVYSPERHTWCQMKNGCVMVTAHAVLGKKLCCMEWKNERKLAIFNPEDNSWKMVPVPVTGSSSVSFRFGILDGKLLLFPL